MKTRFLAIILVLGFLLVTLTACKNEVDQYIGLFDGLAEAAESNKGDCGKLTEAMGKYIEDKKSEIEEIGKKIKEKDSKMTSNQEKDLEKAMERIKTATDGCPEAGFMMLALLAPLME